MITSRQNDAVKHVASLKLKKNRDKYGEFVVEGKKMILDAASCGMRIKTVFATEEAQSLFPPTLNVVSVSEGVLEAMSDEVTPQGSLAVIEIPQSEAIGPLTRCLLLDRVQDPGNVGTILRLAAACGIKDVLCIDSADAFSPKAVRSSMSGIYRVNVHKRSERECLDLLNERRVPLICADMDGEDLFSFNSPGSFCLCVGNEGNGISDNLINNATSVISIPMQGGVESLNVAVATGVTLYSLLYNNQRR